MSDRPTENRLIVEAVELSRIYPMPAGPVTALRDVSLRVRHGDYLAVTGPSGCGKSTLLHLLGCVESPTSGTLRFEGHDVGRLGDARRSRIRLTRIGFVFQRFFLLPMLTAWENVELPQSEAGAGRNERRQRTGELLEYVGLAARATHRPSQLSGGEMQRVAVVRAMINSPELILADEPTGSLDQSSAHNLGQLLSRLNKEEKTTLVVVTHSLDLAMSMDTVYRLNNGKLDIQA